MHSLDSGFHCLDSRFLSLDSGFRSLDFGFYYLDSGFQIRRGFRIPENWPRIRIPDSSDVWILDSTVWIPDCNILKVGFWIPGLYRNVTILSFILFCIFKEYLQGNPEKARKELGWVPKNTFHVSFFRSINIFHNAINE
jgi:hypothetical protein